MVLDAIFDPFVEETPVTVMFRALLERARESGGAG